jgi:hypothetical protein
VAGVRVEPILVAVVADASRHIANDLLDRHTDARTRSDLTRNGYPFQLAAEDKLGYKWCKWVVRIELSTDPDFKGFWERQGYGNDAEVNPRP